MYSFIPKKDKAFIKAFFTVFVAVGVLNLAFSSGIVLLFAEEASVETGDSVASVDVVNEVNVNETNSEGEVLVVSDSLGDSTLDLRDDFSSISSTEDNPCDGCLVSTNIDSQNTATVTNNIILESNTGGNNASSSATTTIETGDAYAGANVVNVVNTNIVESKYMLLVFNNFGDWEGDLVLPNGDFFRNFFSLFAGNCQECGSTSVSNSNLADVSNSLAVLADSGGNSAMGGNASVTTGGAVASSNTLNLVNANVYGRSSFYMLVKVFGDWNGNIFNLPPQIAWKQTPEGLVLYNTNEGDPTVSGQANSLSVNNANAADVENNISLKASTGGNTAEGEEAAIKTGAALAGANVVNIVNTNIVSSNWVAALANIFGNWRGNISFGQPDLWVGTLAEVSGTLSPGSTIKFTATVKNNGDAAASNVKVVLEPKSKFLDISSDKELQLNRLAAGESVEFSYYGIVTTDLPAGHSTLSNKTYVSSLETDAKLSDNTDTVSFVAYSEGGILLPYTSMASTYPKLEVEKTFNIPSSVVVDGKVFVPAGGSVDYTITVRNRGGSAYEGLLFDELRNESGKIITNQRWDLGEILPDEEITVTYTSEFASSTPAGVYRNSAWVSALGDKYVSDPVLGKEFFSNTASASVNLAAPFEVPETSEPVPEPTEPEVTVKSSKIFEEQVFEIPKTERKVDEAKNDRWKNISEVFGASFSIILFINSSKKFKGKTLVL